MQEHKVRAKTVRWESFSVDVLKDNHISCLRKKHCFTNCANVLNFMHEKEILAH